MADSLDIGLGKYWKKYILHSI